MHDDTTPAAPQRASHISDPAAFRAECLSLATQFHALGQREHGDNRDPHMQEVGCLETVAALLEGSAYLTDQGMERVREIVGWSRERLKEIWGDE